MFFEKRFQVVAVIVLKSIGLGAGQPAAVVDAGMIQPIAENDVTAADQRRYHADICQIAAAEEQRRFGTFQSGGFLFKQLMACQAAAHQPGGAAAGPCL